jgi:3-methyladenine DNA glycosylase AlkC
MSALKEMYDRDCLKRLAEAFSFEQKEFMSLLPQLKNLEMKPRVQRIRDEIHKQLAGPYPKALQALVKASRHQKLKAFDLWPFTEFVQTYGLEHPELSLKALRDMTPRFTSEWAVRPFIKKYPQQTMKFLLQCAQDQNESVRRWSSEGLRPRLPWGERLQDFVKDPKPTLPILEKLKFDESLYVRKSVANHLNDIAKDHPDLVVDLLATWKKASGPRHAKKIDWTIRRSLRTLIKAGHIGALNLIGVSAKAQIQLVDFKIQKKKVKMGERMEFEFQIQSLSKKAQNLVIDYIIHFVKSNQSTAPKVFKLKTFELQGNSVLYFKKSHHFKPITTRKYYAGVHSLEIQINGRVLGKQDWILLGS